MKTYARIQAGLVFEIFSTDGDMSEMFHPSLVWVDITEISPHPEVGWSATETDGAWSFSTSDPVPVAQPTTESSS